jgi:bifunctional DNA-binding transcriptional regulator/antitoxin component of YhaV-PrlF toxin-antitoxin module
MKNYVVEQVFVDPSKIIGPPEEAILPFPPEEAKERIRKLDAIVMFEKGLTQSDTSGAGRIVIPKAVAESHFPHLEDTKGIVISLIDVFGVTRGLKFRFWVNNNSRMYIVEGTQLLLRTFKLGVGDVLMFAKDTEGQIFVCGRKGTKDDMFRKPPSFTRKTKRREESQGKGKAAGMDSKRFHAEGQKLAANAPQDPSQVVTGRTRQLSNDEVEISGSYTYWNGLSFPPRSDGVFRAVPITRVREPDQVSVQYGMWCVTVTLAGEQYQAFFDSREAASAALHCAEQSIL